jgi:hypothetical protein
VRPRGRCRELRHLHIRLHNRGKQRSVEMSDSNTRNTQHANQPCCLASCMNACAPHLRHSDCPRRSSARAAPRIRAPGCPTVLLETAIEQLCLLLPMTLHARTPSACWRLLYPLTLRSPRSPRAYGMARGVRERELSLRDR